MAKKECEIIKDLLPNYIEETTSKTTNEYIESHIENCSSCKEILKLLQKEKSKEEIKQKKEEKKEINYLKRYNVKIRIMQAVALLLAGIILGSWIFFGNMLITRWKKEKRLEENERLTYEQGIENYEIISKAYNELERLRASGNYVFISECHNYQDESGNLNYKTTFYYKDGKYKKVEEYEDHASIAVEFGTSKDGKENAVRFTERTVELQNTGGSNEEKRVEMSTYRIEEPYTLKSLYNAGPSSCGRLEIRTEVYQDREYIVVKDGKEYASEIWIDKETNIVLRYIVLKGTDYKEIDNYSIIPDVVTDEDLKIPSTDGYEIDGFTKYLIEYHIDI